MRSLYYWIDDYYLQSDIRKQLATRFLHIIEVLLMYVVRA